MAPVISNSQPIQFGGSHSGANVTLTFSSPGTSNEQRTGANFYRKPGFNRSFQSSNYPQDILLGDGPGRRLRKNVANVRRHVDYVSNILNHLDARLWQYGKRQRPIQQPDELYQNTALPAWCTTDVPVDCVLTKFVRAAMNKVKCPIYSLCWTPEGKRLITGASTGEFTLWNGTAFNFETILQAHDSAIRSMTWSHNEQWLVSADHDGYIKYWQPNMNNVHMFQAHKDDPIRGLSFAPTDVKIASASDDGTARIWDFARYTEERVLRGHGSEVRCVDWHPTKGLIVTGSRDSQHPVKLWDPKSGQCLSTMQDHKSSVMAVSWNSNGNWLLTGGRDHLVKLYDIRVMKEMHTFRGHKKEVASLAWNPVHENLFVSGGGDGSLAYWLVGNEKEVGLLEHAHDQCIWAMQFHPKGHILSTGSNDNNTKFWARNRPGDTQEDIFGLASFTTNMVGALDKEREPKPAQVRTSEDTSEKPMVIPGMGLDEVVRENMNREVSVAGSLTTSTMLLVPEDLNSKKQAGLNNARRVLIKQPPPKKAQRQFERMWNVSKPGAAGDHEEHFNQAPNSEDDRFRRPKMSLLGSHPPSSSQSMLGPNQAPNFGHQQSETPSQSEWNPGRAAEGGPPIGIFHEVETHPNPPFAFLQAAAGKNWHNRLTQGDDVVQLRSENEGFAPKDGHDVDYRTPVGGSEDKERDSDLRSLAIPTSSEIPPHMPDTWRMDMPLPTAHKNVFDPRVRKIPSTIEPQQQVHDPRRRLSSVTPETTNDANGSYLNRNQATLQFRSRPDQLVTREPPNWSPSVMPPSTHSREDHSFARPPSDRSLLSHGDQQGWISRDARTAPVQAQFGRTLDRENESISNWNAQNIREPSQRDPREMSYMRETRTDHDDHRDNRPWASRNRGNLRDHASTYTNQRQGNLSADNYHNNDFLREDWRKGYNNRNDFERNSGGPMRGRGGGRGRGRY